jgi:GxxExxY protein
MRSGTDERDPLTQKIIDCAMRVHTAFGPGLLESTYEVCLEHAIRGSGLEAKRQVSLPVSFESVRLDAGYRIDLLVQAQVIVEVKSVDKLMPIHSAQLLTYLRLSRLKTGLIINFNVLHLRDGLKRLSN